jgi:UPF0716 protein FxsA
VAGDLFGPRRVRVHRGDPTTAPADTGPVSGPVTVPASGRAIEGEIVR